LQKNYNVQTYFLKKTILWRKIYSFLKYSRIYFFDTKISKFINYSIEMCWICIYTIVIKIILIILKVLWIYQIMCVFYIPWICCGGYNFLLMCVISWIKYMGWGMTCWHISITRRGKKNDLKKWFSLWANRQYLEIGCKLKWAKLEKP